MDSERGAEAAGRTALAALDAILAQEPEPDPGLFSKATRCLSLYRDGLIESGRRTHLERVNAVISIVMAGHFPLGPVPWAELHNVRGWLSEATKPAG